MSYEDQLDKSIDRMEGLLKNDSASSEVMIDELNKHTLQCHQYIEHLADRLEEAEQKIILIHQVSKLGSRTCLFIDKNEHQDNRPKDRVLNAVLVSVNIINTLILKREIKNIEDAIAYFQKNLQEAEININIKMIFDELFSNLVVTT